MFDKKFKQIKKNLTKQDIDLPDGSVLTIKVKPKLGNRTKATIEWNKSIEDVDFNIMVSGQPIRICQEGFQYNPEENEYFKAELSATKRF